MSVESIYAIFLVMLLLHLHLVILNAMEAISLPWALVLFPEIVVAVVVIGGVTLVAAIVIYAHIYTCLGRCRHNGK